MTWRPKDWENLHIKQLPDGSLQYGGTRYYDFEAGADAMLEVLKKYGTRTPDYTVIPMIAMKGWIVFIPDEEVKP